MINSLEDFIYQHPEFSDPERKGEGYLTNCPVCHKRHMYVSQKQNKIVVYCQHSSCNAGMEEVVKACGINRSDFFIGGETPKKILLESREHVYHYENGNIFGRKIIKKYTGSEKKEARWEKYENGSYINGLKGTTAPLFNLPVVATSQDPDLFVVEGEKDVETMKQLGFVATSLPNGGNQTKWAEEYAKYFKGKSVYIITDNDDTGEKYGKFVAQNVFPVATTVKVIGAKSIHSDVPIKGDITDIVNAIGDNNTILALADAIDKATLFSPADSETPFTARDNSFFNLFVPLKIIEEKEAEWVLGEVVPRGGIVLLSGDGGTGKSSISGHIAKSITTGTLSIFDSPDASPRKPGLLAFFTREESVEVVMKRRFREAGVDQNLVFTLDPQNEEAKKIIKEFYFDSDYLKRFIEHYKPTLCIFDPIQGFIPPDVQMGSRNAMRHCLTPLSDLGDEYGTTFLLICHTNKRQNAYGRDRLADSADLWDIARSVLMVGMTGENEIRYISNEKNNYAPLQKTVLFSIDDNGQIVYEGDTYKQDRDFQAEKDAARSKPMRNNCKQAIFDVLQEAPNKSMPSDDLQKLLVNKGFSSSTIRRAKQELTKSQTIKSNSDQYGGKWKISLIGTMPIDDK